METLLSSVLSEVMARSINFILSKASPPAAPALENSLPRALLRAQVIVDEATGRHVTNQAMLLQLDMLRDAVHKGNYALDSFRYQPHAAEHDDRGQPVRRSSLFVANCAKIPRSSRGSTRILAQLREALDRLSSMVADADVLVLLLTSYPRRYRQPYGMHLMLDNCMFGRQMETEHVISFLLHAQPSHGAEEPEVLPIVGPGRVGKTTLVTHVCKDERVRDRFAEIVLLTDLHFTDAELAALGQRCSSVRNGNNRGSNSNSRDGKFLIVVEVAGDFNEDAWSRLYSASKRWAPLGSKIIVTSRSDKITKVGTARPLALKFLQREAYGYLFRTLAFGGADPGAHPGLASMTMEVAGSTDWAFISAHITARVLRGNLDARFWGKVLAHYREFIDRHGSRFGGNPFATLNQEGPALLGRMGRAFADLVVRHHYRWRFRM